MTGKLCCRNERAEEQSLFRRCPSLLSLTLMSVLLSPLSLQAADMRNGFNGLASKVQNVLKDDPFSGHIFVFRGRSGKMVKILWADRDGLCLF
ncbi:IS66 family insertion sequence element accessory protein TnpB, partial [Escherichia albertii]|uniref:IS66 family insertion sequence element accessory protein TnpB n=1 Tax=Escherichia albertii TaxID=208962 RepID=UPI0023EA4CF3